jgi:hypothetical protein
LTAIASKTDRLSSPSHPRYCAQIGEKQQVKIKKGRRGSPLQGYAFTNRFRQVTRLVNVSAFDQRNVISQQLQRYGVEDRGDGLFDMRHLNDVHVVAAVEAGVTVGETYSSPPRARTSSMLDFSFSSSSLFGATITGISASISASGPCLSSPRIGFRVNVGDLFQLQRPFHSDRVLIATAKEQRMSAYQRTLCQLLNTLVLGEHLLDTVRQRLQAVDDIMLNGRILTFHRASFATSISSTVS